MQVPDLRIPWPFGWNCHLSSFRRMRRSSRTNDVTPVTSITFVFLLLSKYRRRSDVCWRLSKSQSTARCRCKFGLCTPVKSKLLTFSSIALGRVKHKFWAEIHHGLLTQSGSLVNYQKKFKITEFYCWWISTLVSILLGSYTPITQFSPLVEHSHTLPHRKI